MAGQSTRLERADRAEPSTQPDRQRYPSVITAGKAPAPANDDGPRWSAIVTVRDRKTVQHPREQQQMAGLLAADQPKKSAIITARKPRSWRSTQPDMSPEEHKRRGDGADALFRELTRRIGAAAPPQKKPGHDGGR